MLRIPSTSRSRVLASIGAGAAVVFMLAVGEMVFASSFTYGAASAVVALLAMGVLLWALRGSRHRKPGASTNTQLQHSPPAIIERE